MAAEVPAAARSGSDEHLPQRDLRSRMLQRIALVVILVGIATAGLGIATFKAPTCTDVSPTQPASCSAWETSQWLMIGGVLSAVPALLYLANSKMHERVALASEPARGER